VQKISAGKGSLALWQVYLGSFVNVFCYAYNHIQVRRIVQCPSLM
jgi:hypothetical protein